MDSYAMYSLIALIISMIGNLLQWVLNRGNRKVQQKTQETEQRANEISSFTKQLEFMEKIIDDLRLARDQDAREREKLEIACANNVNEIRKLNNQVNVMLKYGCVNVGCATRSGYSKEKLNDILNGTDDIITQI